MSATPQPQDIPFPCEAMYHEDEETGMTALMFERPLTQTERMQVREGLVLMGHSHWVDEQTLLIANPNSD